MADAPRYRAFLSYSHADKDQAEAWRTRLESLEIHWAYHADEKLRGSVPERFKYVFRDEFDARLGRHLDDEIKDKLKRSDALILLGSPSARKSTYVNKEVEYFRSEFPEIGRAHV